MMNGYCNCDSIFTNADPLKAQHNVQPNEAPFHDEWPFNCSYCDNIFMNTDPLKVQHTDPQNEARSYDAIQLLFLCEEIHQCRPSESST